MNDLSGLDWSSKPQDSNKPPVTNPSYTFANLKPSPPVSGRSTPFAGLGSQPASKPATPANDSFANLVSFNTSNPNKNLSLQERQRQLAEEKKKQASARTSPFSGVDEHVWESLGSGRSTPALTGSAQKGKADLSGRTADNEDNFLAAFNKPSSPPIPVRANGSFQPTAGGRADQGRFTENQPRNGALEEHDDDSDDDPFGLKDFKSVKPPSAPAVENDGDDVLGLLGQPVESLPKRSTPTTKASGPTSVHPQDQAIAELVDMGFPPEKAKEALETTESGTDVQAAVGFLLTQAHSEARQKLKPQSDGGAALRPQSTIPDRSRARFVDEEGLGPQRRRQDTSTSSQKDPAQIAGELSANFLKSAGSFWKQSTKKIQQAVEDFNSDSDSNQPRWMRESDRNSSEKRSQAHEDEAGVARRRRRSSAARQESNATNEAMMLETARPEPRGPTQRRFESKFDSSADTSRDHSPAVSSRLRESAPSNPAFLRQQQRPPAVAPMPTLSRAAIEEQASQAYVSSARRRKAPTKTAVSASEPDLLNSNSQPSLTSSPITTRPSQSSKSSTPIAVRPSAPPRVIPSVLAIALKSSHAHREAGNNHFKRGDYSSAHTSYATSLSNLPPGHPITIILLTNRALTALKTGEPKSAIVDSDAAIKVIGPSKGESEVVDLGTGDSPKPMREYYGKALMRKAEALEQMERWPEAAAVWRDAVEGGHGGANSIQARARAEKAANPQASKPRPPATIKKQTTAIPSRRSVVPSSSSAVSNTQSAAAVAKLRAQNQAADRLDDEKFALADAVDARLTAWKGGKADNLRALLASLDAVLWAEAGWKKIGMADLVLPGKVKVQYMKGIAKVHPDKIPTTATTEQRMISSAVFSTLNEAWDKFKTENGL